MAPPLRLAAFDNDGTLQPEKGIWQYLQEPTGLFAGEGERLLREHLAGGSSYEEFVRATIRRWAGVPARPFLDILDRLPLRPNAHALLLELRARGVKLVNLSAGLDWWEAVWRERFDFEWDYFAANQAVVDAEGNCTGEVIIRVTDDGPRYNKGTHLRRLQEEWGIAPAETIAVGDGNGDIHLFHAAGSAWCIAPSNERVRAAANGGELLTGDFAELRAQLDL